MATAVATYGSADRAPAAVRLPTPNDLRYSGSHDAVMKKPHPITAWHQHRVATCKDFMWEEVWRHWERRGSDEEAPSDHSVAPAQNGNLQGFGLSQGFEMGVEAQPCGEPSSASSECCTHLQPLRCSPGRRLSMLVLLVLLVLHLLCCCCSRLPWPLLPLRNCFLPLALHPLQLVLGPPMPLCCCGTALASALLPGSCLQ